MSPIDDLLRNYREVVATMRGNIAAFKERNMTLYEDRGAGPVDITSEWIARMKEQADGLQRVIADLENFTPPFFGSR